MAEAIRPWKGIVHLDPDEARRITRTLRTAGVGSAIGRAEDEIRAYAEFVGSLEIRRRSIAVVKPHPRDGAEKIGALRAALAPAFAEVLVLEDSDLAFQPFELLLMEGFLRPDLTLASDVSIVCFSSACLSLGLLFGAGSTLGFGERIVRQRFRPEHVPNRLREEADLRAALAGLLRRPLPAPEMPWAAPPR